MARRRSSPICIISISGVTTRSGSRLTKNLAASWFPARGIRTRAGFTGPIGGISRLTGLAFSKAGLLYGRSSLLPAVASYVTTRHDRAVTTMKAFLVGPFTTTSARSWRGRWLTTAGFSPSPTVTLLP